MLSRSLSEFNARTVGVVALCFSIGVIGRFSPEHFPNLVAPLGQEFNWDRSQIASIFSICALTTGLSGPIAGFLFDRFGPLKLYLIGIFSISAGLVLAGFSISLWQFYAGLGVCIGFAAACCGNVANSALISRWFQEKLALALALVFSSLGIGSFLGLSVSQLLISEFGWRNAEITLGLSVLCLIPVLLILPWKKLTRGRRFKPPSGEQKPDVPVTDWTLRSALKTSSFWGFTAVFFITANGMYAVVIQSVTYLVERGLTPLESSFNVGLTGMFIPVGMISCGYLLTRFNNIVVSLATYVITIAATLCLWAFDTPEKYWALYGFILLFGLTMGSRGPVVGSLAARIFRGRSFGAIYGSITTGGGLGAASGSFLSGWIYDITLSYDAVFFFAVTCLAIGALPFIVVPRIRRAGLEQK
ncbi:MAG: MFS transporter [Sneathiellales bacterium]|nr:MFS transporter [Sneathiellales bacterium]